MAIDPKAKAYFAATFESLKNGEIPLKKEGTVVIDVEFTKYKMTLEIESDRIAKIKYIEISDIT